MSMYTVAAQLAAYSLAAVFMCNRSVSQRTVL